MKRLGTSAIYWFMVLILILVSLLMIALSFKPAAAQDMGITICRDTSYPTLRFEFRNIPASWFTYGSDAVWGYWAEGIQYEQGVLIADALTQDTDGYVAGTATVLDYDNSLTLIGDATTAPCDVPAPPAQTAACPAQAWNPAKGAIYCYAPLASGIVPLPEAS